MNHYVYCDQPYSEFQLKYLSTLLAMITVAPQELNLLNLFLTKSFLFSLYLSLSSHNPQAVSVFHWAVSIKFSFLSNGMPNHIFSIFLKIQKCLYFSVKDSIFSLDWCTTSTTKKEPLPQNKTTSLGHIYSLLKSLNKQEKCKTRHLIYWHFNVWFLCLMVYQHLWVI